MVGAPCDQFGGQAPGSSEEEREAAIAKFGIQFPVLDKLDVNGSNTHPIYQVLKRAQPVAQPSSLGGGGGGRVGEVAWNYEKFLVSRDGVPLKRWKSAFDPMEFEGDVRLALAGRPPLPAECFAHPGRIVCNVDRLLEGAA